MNMDDAENLFFITDEDELVEVQSYVWNKSTSESLEYFGVEESEDEAISRHLARAKTIWLISSEPHYVLPHVSSEHGGLPPFVITARLSHNSEKIVVVFHSDLHPDKTIKEIFQMYLHQIHFSVLAGIDAEEDRKMFDWYYRN